MPGEEEIRKFSASVEGELKKLVGTVRRELPAREALEEGLTDNVKKAKRGGKFLLLEVPGFNKLFPKWKSDTKPVDEEERRAS